METPIRGYFPHWLAYSGDDDSWNVWEIRENALKSPTDSATSNSGNHGICSSFRSTWSLTLFLASYDLSIFWPQNIKKNIYTSFMKHFRWTQSDLLQCYYLLVSENIQKYRLQNSEMERSQWNIYLFIYIYIDIVCIDGSLKCVQMDSNRLNYHNYMNI